MRFNYRIKRKKFRSPDGLPVDICIFTLTIEDSTTKRKSLPNYRFQVLLVRREDEPFQNNWAFPGGFSKINQTLLDAAIGKLKEKTNVSEDVHIEQLQTYYSPGRDPRGWIPSVVYYAIVPSQRLEKMRASGAVNDAKLFNVEEVPELEMAFDHMQIFQDAVAKIKERVLTSTIAKEFLPEEFTISELYSVITKIVPEVTEKRANFIRKLTEQGIIMKVVDCDGNVKESDKYSQRPAALYKFTGFQPTLSLYHYDSKKEG